MKKLLAVIILILLSTTCLFAEPDTGLNIKISEAMEGFSRAWLEVYPDPVAKQGIAVLEIENDSDKAESAKIGELVRAYLEEAMELSLIFVLTDRDNLKKIVDEIKFSASGMVSDDSSVEIGEITGTAGLISGNITEEGGDFRVQLKLTEIESGEVITLTSFSLPQKDLIDASIELGYEYVAPNGIGLSVKPSTYIFGATTFNNGKPINLDIAVKYRISRALMISSGIKINLISGMDIYRWDPSKFPEHTEVTFGQFQPALEGEFKDEVVGQITGELNEAATFHLDFQYTINFHPVFNVGLNAGFVSVLNPVMTVRYSSTKGLYFNDAGYADPNNLESTDVIQVDDMALEYIFDPAVGGKFEIVPEFFITPRFAVSATAGYQYLFPAKLKAVNASEGQWGFHEMDIESGFSDYAVEKYFGFDPSIMPDGSTWTLDFSGFYAGLAFSIFF